MSPSVGEHHRVVGGGIHLDRDDVPDPGQRVARRAVHLRRTPHRVGILDATAVRVGRVDRAAVQQAHQVVGRRGLAGERTRGVDARIERMHRSLQGVDRERRGDVGRARQAFGAGQRQRQHRGRDLRAVDERQSFLRVRGRPASAQRRRARRAALATRLPSHISPSPISTSARCASGARSPLAPTDPRLGHARMHAVIEQREQRVERLDANARVALGQHVGAQRHRGAHRAHRQRLVDAGGVAAQQIDLQRRQIVARRCASRRSCRSRC